MSNRCRYSFIIVMRDRMFLVNSWPFLVKHLRSLIDNLQKKVRDGERTLQLMSFLARLKRFIP